MKCKLYTEPNDNYGALEQILVNRGISIEDQDEWLSAGKEQLLDWKLLGEEKMRKAANLLYKHIKEENDIVIVVDCDVDGWTSSALLINYLYDNFGTYTENHVNWIHHKGKEHGLQDTIKDILKAEKYSLVICPDSATNDIEQHKMLKQYGIDCIVLDHHLAEIDIEDSPAIIINNQTSDYPNKALTGAGIVYKFLECLNQIQEETSEGVEKYLDICALGNCGDMADYRISEIRALINLGFANIRNPFFKAMSAKNSYSIDKMNGINYLSVAFYVVPFANCCLRSGTMEEKELVFNSFLHMHAYDKIETSKRGHKGEIVPLYEEAVLVAERVKRRQTKLQDESMANLEAKIEEQNLLENAVLFLLCEPGEVEKNITGLAANKAQAKYQRPTLVLIRQKVPSEDKYVYSGSARNYSLSEIENFKSVIEGTEDFIYALGHEGAFGASIEEDKIEDATKHLNEIYKDVDLTPIYWVDYIWTPATIDGDKILDIGGLTIYGQNIPESLVYIKDIPVSQTNVTLMSEDKHPTLKIRVNGIDIIKFGSSREEFEEFCQEDMYFSAVCKCKINEWNGRVSPQLIVEDFELKEDWIF